MRIQTPHHRLFNTHTRGLWTSHYKHIQLVNYVYGCGTPNLQISTRIEYVWWTYSSVSSK